MFNKLAQIEHMVSPLWMTCQYYQQWAFNIPLNAVNLANTLFADRFDALKYMYIGTTSPNNYVLGRIINHVEGMTYGLTGTDAARFAISSTGEITLVNNSGLVEGTLTFNVVHNLMGTIPITVPVVSPTSAVSFFDSVNGSDANSGRQPHLPKLTLNFTGAQATRCIRRGSNYSADIRFSQNTTTREYGDPTAAAPNIANPTGIANMRNTDKSGQPGVAQGCSNVLIEGLNFIGGPNVQRAIHFINVQNGVAKRCTASGNISGSNSQAFVASGNVSNIVFRQCDANGYNGDGIYITYAASGYNEIAFCHIRPPIGTGTADCLQVTGENNFSQRNKNVHIHHNILDYGERAWTGAGKGTAVTQELDGYAFEYNLCKGGYFGIGAMGSRGTIRFNYFFNCRFTNTINNEWGAGQGANQYSMELAFYGNIIDSSNRGLMIGGYSAPTGGWRRPDTVFKYNTVMNCGEVFRASERWTGEVTKNIFVNNYNQVPYNTGNGATLADITGTVTITQTAGVATVLFNNHYLGAGDLFTIAGANEVGYNLADAPVIATPNQNSFTYAVDPGTPSPATGTITYQKKRKYTTQTLTGNIAQAYLGTTLNVIPTVTGTVQDGQLLTCNTTPQAGLTYEYQWLINADDEVTTATFSLPALTSNRVNRWMPAAINYAEVSCLVIATNATGMKTYAFAIMPNGLFSQRVIA